MSRSKGKRGEYMLVDALVEAIGIEFKRTPQSGCSQLKEGWNLAGDVATPDPDWTFCLEMKNREAWHLELLWSDKSPIWKWWTQVCEDSHLTGLMPALVFKRNHVSPLVMIVAEGVLEVEDVMFFADPAGTPIAIMPLPTWLRMAKRVYDARKEERCRRDHRTS